MTSHRTALATMPKIARPLLHPGPGTRIDCIRMNGPVAVRATGCEARAEGVRTNERHRPRWPPRISGPWPPRGGVAADATGSPGGAAPPRSLGSRRACSSAAPVAAGITRRRLAASATTEAGALASREAVRCHPASSERITSTRSCGRPSSASSGLPRSSWRSSTRTRRPSAPGISRSARRSSISAVSWVRSSVENGGSSASTWTRTSPWAGSRTRLTPWPSGRSVSRNAWPERSGRWPPSTSRRDADGDRPRLSGRAPRARSSRP